MAFDACMMRAVLSELVTLAPDAKIEKVLQPGGDEIDMLIYMRDPDAYQSMEEKEVLDNLLRLCDIHNVPVATNLATAEVLINGVERGDLAWRDIVNPK